MDNQSNTTPEQAAITPSGNSEAIEAQAEMNQNQNYSGGSAMLDAKVATENQINETLEQPAATNQSEDTATTDPTQAMNVETTGAYPADFSQLDDQGDLSIAKDNPANE